MAQNRLSNVTVEQVKGGIIVFCVSVFAISLVLKSFSANNGFWFYGCIVDYCLKLLYWATGKRSRIV